MVSRHRSRLLETRPLLLHTVDLDASELAPKSSGAHEGSFGVDAQPGARARERRRVRGGRESVLSRPLLS
jgi:hypothetical protein